MTRHTDLAELVLDLVSDRADAEVLVGVGTSSLTRFANSFIHQNVSEDVSEVMLRVATADGRIASSTSTVPNRDALSRFVDDTLEVAGQQPIDKDWPGFGGPVTGQDVDHWDEATAAADPTDRAQVVKAFVDAGGGLLAAGYCETVARDHAYANTEGRSVTARYTTAVLDGIHQTDRSAGSGHTAGRSLAALEAHETGAAAAKRARDSVDAFDAKPGEFEVVLSPECLATIAVFLDVYGFNAKVAQEGMSFVDVGTHQFDPSVNLWDDATDPRALHIGFDTEGTPKGRVDMVKAGITAGLVHNRRTAAKAGTESTGHAGPGSEVWGPFAMNVFVGGGETDVEDLIGGVDRGIYVSTFNYCRVLDPKSLVVTGLTRNGTFMIENGRITHPVSNMRFTQSFVGALGPEKVLGIGNDARFADSEFGPLIVHAPSMRLASWNFTGGAAG
ncbi:MAG: TldD/PmbA family protein [Acidimicrobiia bacterium]